LKIHEYQAKAVLARYGVPVPRGEVAFSAAAAADIASRLGGDVVVVKAQIHAGGRGKGGGVKLAKSPEQAEQIAKEMLGMTLVTHQTGPEGKKVNRVLIEEGVQIDRELYLSILIDRAAEAPVVIASAAGGMDIEEVAASQPEKILNEPVDRGTGVVPFQARRLAFGMGLDSGPANKFVKLLDSIYTAFIATDASMIEINPLILTKSGDLLALDAKVSFDDNALYRHTDIRELRDTTEEDPLEVEASKFNLNYIRLDGNIGCMVNGAGLAMATMDVIKLAGSEPANFLDVGGGATKETVAAGFRILLKDKNVKGIFINIFGGIVRCERIAHGVIEAAKEVNIKIPVVVRLQGTNAEEGRKLLLESGLKVEVATDLWEAAQKIVAATGKKKRASAGEGRTAPVSP
jgi:succinyl-CoA synthetase beta subunit